MTCCTPCSTIGPIASGTRNKPLLHTQDLGAVAMQKQGQPNSEGRPVHVLFNAQREGLNVDGVIAAEMDMVAVVVMAEIAVVTVRVAVFGASRASAELRRAWSLDRICRWLKAPRHRTLWNLRQRYVRSGLDG